MMRTAALVMILLLPLLAAAEETKPSAERLDPEERQKQQKRSDESFEPTSAFEKQDLRGWTVYVHRRLLEDDKELGDKALELLGMKLYGITRVVPPEVLARLQEIPIWLEYEDPKHPRCAYHPDKKWLRDHGMNPDKARSVEISNAARFLRVERIQPWMVMHELAHGYHHRVLGHNHEGILNAFERARESKSYESVLYYNGRKRRAYALKNEKEYFAELTEAWLGRNDFYPFVRAEVLDHDPEMAKVLEGIWGKK